MSKKFKKYHEKGSVSFVLKVQFTTIAIVVVGLVKEFIPKFYHSDSIVEF